MNDRRSQIGRIAAHESWARTDDRTARTAPARNAMLAKFEHQVDPENKLTPAERAKRAESAKKAYFQRLALKSAKVRAGRKKHPSPTGPSVLELAEESLDDDQEFMTLAGRTCPACGQEIPL